MENARTIKTKSTEKFRTSSIIRNTISISFPYRRVGIKITNERRYVRTTATDSNRR